MKIKFLKDCIHAGIKYNRGTVVDVRPGIARDLMTCGAGVPVDDAPTVSPPIAAPAQAFVEPVEPTDEVPSDG